MRRPFALLATIVVVIAGIAWFVVSVARDRKRDDRAALSSAVATPSRPVAAAPESAANPTRVNEPVRDVPSDEKASARESEQAKSATDEVAADVVEGTVVVVDDASVEHSSCTGDFHPTIWSGRTGHGAEAVRVDAGRFRVSVPVGKEIEVGDLELDGRAAIAKPDRFAIEPGRPLTVHARWSKDVFLHVVDATTHEELHEVTVLWSDDWRLSGTTHPGTLRKDHVLFEHAQSPITTQARDHDGWIRWDPMLYATAPGHAWGSTGVDYRLGGEETIEIPGGGDLEVSIEGEIPELPALRSGERDEEDARVVIRLREPPRASPVHGDVDEEVARELRDDADTTEGRRAAGDQPASGNRFAESRPSKDGVTRFSGLVPGPLMVTLERGSDWRDPFVLAHSSASIVEGGKTHVTLRIVAADDSGKRVPLSGTVHFSDEWHRSYLDLGFEPVTVKGATSVDRFKLELKDLARVDGTPGLYRFDAGRVLPGRYVVSSYSLAFQQPIDTGSAGTDHAEIAIGDPADVVVHVVDADSGSPLSSPPELHWSCKRPAESRSGNVQYSEWDDSIQAARLRAPAGEIELAVSFDHDLQYETVGSNVIHAKPGANEVTLRLRALIVVNVKVTIDGAEANWPVDFSFRMMPLVAVDVPGIVVNARGFSDEFIRFNPPRPGRYVLQVPTVGEFEAVAPIEVEARRGESVVVTVPLRRVH